MKWIALYLIMASSHLFAVERGDKITFYDSVSRKNVIGEVLKVLNNDMVMARHQVFTESTNTFKKVTLSPSEFFKTVDSLNGFSLGEKVCFGKEKGELTAIFENGDAEMTVGDFFGTAFFIFKRPVLVNLSNIKNYSGNN